ncbi:MAG: hypothetical protein AAF443_00455 [Chlamydiota bacterium]
MKNTYVGGFVLLFLTDSCFSNSCKKNLVVAVNIFVKATFAAAISPCFPGALYRSNLGLKYRELLQERVFFAFHPTPEEVGFLSEFDKIFEDM